jgi:hypothetical protein
MVENELLAQLIDPLQALQWVTTHIKPYFPATRITCMVIRNEIFTHDDNTLCRILSLPQLAFVVL